MDKKPNLYEILGVLQTATSDEINHACAVKLAELEQGDEHADNSSLAIRKQMIRVAANTLKDPASRLTYDAKLARDADPSAFTSKDFVSDLPYSVVSEMALTPKVAPSQDREAVNLRAEALSLRAEALSLRAEALILHTNSGAVAHHSSASAGRWLGLLTSGALWRVLMFLVIMGGLALGLSQCAARAPFQSSSEDTKAMERAALQEYFQTHGVRPANMAELELLQTERRRLENEQRSSKQDVDQKKREEREFEEESRRRAQEVSERLRAEEERHQYRLEQDQREQREQERILRERKESERLAEEQRLQRLEEHWKQVIRR